MMIFRGLKSANFVKIILISKVIMVYKSFNFAISTFLKMQEIYLKHFCGDSWHFFTDTRGEGCGVFMFCNQQDYLMERKRYKPWF
jgi:hypothetical protein